MAKKKSAKTKSGREARRKERASVPRRVEVSSRGKTFSTTIRDLTDEGAFILTEEPLFVGAQVDLKIWLEPNHTIDLKARVARRASRNEPRGVGVTFFDADRSDKRAVAGVVKEVLNEDARRAINAERQELLDARRALLEDRINLEEQRVLLSEEQLKHQLQVKEDESKLIAMRRDIDRDRGAWEVELARSQARIAETRSRLASELEIVRRWQGDLADAERDLAESRSQLARDIAETREKLESERRDQLEDLVRQQKLLKKIAERREQERQDQVDEQLGSLERRHQELMVERDNLAQRAADLTEKARSFQVRQEEKRTELSLRIKEVETREALHERQHKATLAALQAQRADIRTAVRDQHEMLVDKLESSESRMLELEEHLEQSKLDQARLQKELSRLRQDQHSTDALSSERLVQAETRLRELEGALNEARARLELKSAMLAEVLAEVEDKRGSSVH